MSDTTVDTGRSGPDDVEDDLDDVVLPGRQHTPGFVFGEMLLFAALSLLASFVLSVDAIKIAENPDVILGCSINSVLDCARVGASWQAHVLGFPNAFIGLVAEPVVMTIAVASLAGTRFPRWFMFTANVVYFLGVVFAYWLLWQSTFEIGALCPWCLLVTVSTTFVFVSMTHWNVLHDNLYLPAGVQARAFSAVAKGYLMAGLVIWLTLVLAFEVVKWGPRLLSLG
ncbi:vitamin K epoxide reductase family protein [Phycicoccus sonneratiae]|uniref:Vitamin K epoxide reductase family protein n=1 Tax=Phycicoccus sonneratiae TaxID=2807628 RepID=A0ABS2CJ79_9MICO|nr:vitamin K epoxide reductase family protein [Phycicoccus sonneraticus]MBM6399934.1 vitamin K epoxide reductase family protein [Phycicoccus sonneraticus]